MNNASDSDFYHVDEERADDVSDEVVSDMKRHLSCHFQVYLSLKQVSQGHKSKLRFTILLPCPQCKVANYLPARFGKDLLAARTGVCSKCKNNQKFGMQRVFNVWAPIGTRNGTSTTYFDEGFLGYEGVRGDVVITFLDEPHEHFLRTEDDLIVCFQIDPNERTQGVTRMLKLDHHPETHIVLKTKPGEILKNMDICYAADLGLPNHLNTETKGNLYVLFFVTPEKCMHPVKLVNIRIKPTQSKLSSQLSGLRFGSTAKPIRNGHDLRKSKRPRKRKREVDLDSDCNKDDSLDRNTRRQEWNRVASNRLSHQDVEKFSQLDVPSLSFLDRIVYRQTIPLPHKAEVEQIPMTDLRILWDKKFDGGWWKRIKEGKSFETDHIRGSSYDPRSNRRDERCVKSFELEVVEQKQASDALKTIITRLSSYDPNYPCFRLRKLTSSQRGALLSKIQEYIQLPKL